MRSEKGFRWNYEPQGGHHGHTKLTKISYGTVAGVRYISCALIVIVMEDDLIKD